MLILRSLTAFFSSRLARHRTLGLAPGPSVGPACPFGRRRRCMLTRGTASRRPRLPVSAPWLPVSAELRSPAIHRQRAERRPPVTQQTQQTQGDQPRSKGPKHIHLAPFAFSHYTSSSACKPRWMWSAVQIAKWQPRQSWHEQAWSNGHHEHRESFQN